MIKDLFLSVINMTITGSVAIVGVMLLRGMFRKMPKVYSYMLWGIVLFRLLCPYSLSLDTSVFNTVPAVQTESGRLQYEIPPEIVGTAPVTGRLTEEIVPEDVPVNTTATETLPVDNYEDIENSYGYIPTENKIVVTDTDSFDIRYFIPYLWMAGVIYFLCANLLSLHDTKKLLAGSVHIKDNIYMSTNIPTAFIMGIICPKIYLPEGLDESRMEYVILHEQTHIRRKDYLFKLLGFGALCLHWFNPLVWIAFKLAEKDMEMSCDEAVIKDMSRSEKRRYSTTLLTIGTQRNLGNTAIAFSEGETKDRIKNVLGFIKPKQKYIALVAVAICGAVAVLAFNPAKPTAYSAAIGKGECSEIVLTSGDDYKHLTGESTTDLLKAMKQAEVTPVENTEEINFTNSVILVTDNRPYTAYFDESYSYMAIDGNESKNYYSIKNREYLKDLSTDILNNQKYKPVTVTYPAFWESTNRDPEIKPFTLSFDLPEKMYIYDDDKMTFSNWHNTVDIFDDLGNSVGDIGFCANILESDFARGNEWPLRYGLDAFTSYDVIKNDESGHILKSYTDRHVRFYIYDKALECFVIIRLESPYNTEEIVNRISDTIMVTPVENYEALQVDNRPKFWVKPDESEEGIANAAAMRYIQLMDKEYEYRLVSARMGTHKSYEEMTDRAKDRLINPYFKYIVYAEIEVNGLHEYPLTTNRIIYVDEYQSDGGENHVINGWYDSGPEWGAQLPVTEIHTVETERIVPVEHGVDVEKNNEMNLGTTEVIRAGRRGLTRQTVVQEIVNGIVISEKVTDSVTLKEAVNEKIVHGTLWNGEVISGGSGKLIWPTGGGRVSRGFVDQYPSHNGVDIAGPVGTEIYAAADGIVDTALYSTDGYGIHIVLKHDGYKTLYGQCSKLLVSKGREVKQGQLIAYMGSTGNSTGPHLHFEVMAENGGERYDPYLWF